jgi:hypothetical protein
MMIKRSFALLAALFACTAQASLVWQPAPAKPNAQETAGGHGGHGGGRAGKAFVLQGGRNGELPAEAELWLPTQVRRPLPLNGAGQVAVSGTGLNSYHLLYAKRQDGEREEVAMRYLYMQGKPVEVSPSELVNAPKAALEITPAPLTREHQRYLSLKPANFILRYRGEPLAQHPVLLTTSNGSELQGSTDSRGRITLYLPDDFSEVEPGRRNNRPAEFVVATGLEVDGRRYHTTLSAPYFVSPHHWQSFTGGLLAMCAGVISGLVVLRRSRKGNEAHKAEEA